MITDIETENLHWVLEQFDNKSFRMCLTNTENLELSCPILSKLTTEETEKLNQSNVKYRQTPRPITPNPAILFNVCLPNDNARASITAPLFIKLTDGDYLETGGVYTETWTHPKEYKRINETVNMLIPKEKIIHPGCYVDLVI